MPQLVHRTEYLHPTCFAGLDPHRAVTAHELDVYPEELPVQGLRANVKRGPDPLLMHVFQELRSALRGALKDFSVTIPHNGFSRDGVQYGRLLGDPLASQIGETQPFLLADPDLKWRTLELLRMFELRVGLRKTLGDHKNLLAMLSRWEGQTLSMGDLRRVSSECSSAIGNLAVRYRADCTVLPKEARVPEANRQIGQWACDRLDRPLDFRFSYRSSIQQKTHLPHCD